MLFSVFCLLITVVHFSIQVSAKLGEEATAKSKETCTSKEIKQTSSSAVGTHQTGNSLLDGAYDEGSSAASFQEALTEWRTGGSKKPTTSRGENTYQTKGMYMCMCVPSLPSTDI